MLSDSLRYCCTWVDEKEQLKPTVKSENVKQELLELFPFLLLVIYVRSNRWNVIAGKSYIENNNF